MLLVLRFVLLLLVVVVLALLPPLPCCSCSCPCPPPWCSFSSCSGDSFRSRLCRC